jgi:hypothetical protein
VFGYFFSKLTAKCYPTNEHMLFSKNSHFPSPIHFRSAIRTQLKKRISIGQLFLPFLSRALFASLANNRFS